MSDYVNVIYNKETGKVLVLETDGDYVIPSAWDIAHFENGVEPVLIEKDSGIYLSPNKIIWPAIGE